MQSITYELTTPIVKGENRVTKLNIVRPRISHFKGINLCKVCTTDHEEWLKLLPNICPELEGLTNNLSPFDLLKIMDEASVLLLPELSPVGKENLRKKSLSQKASTLV